MKTKINTYLKLGVLLFGISLFMTNCNNDDQSIIDESQKEQTTPLILSQKIPFSEAMHFNKLETKINEIKDKLNNSSIQNRVEENEDIIILTDEVSYTTYAGTYTYTFKVLRAQPQAFIENIVLHYNIETDNYDEYLVQYHISADEFINLNSGEFLESSENVTIIDLENGFFDSNTQARGCDRVCNTIYTDCSSGEHHSGNVGSWGSCTASESPSAYQSCTVICDEISAGDSSTGGGMSPSGGGSSAVVSNPFPTEPCEDSSGGDIGITGSNGDCFSPETYENIQKIDNCINNANLNIQLLSEADLIAIVKFINNNGCSNKNKEFIVHSIVALLNNGEVNFEEEIINELTGKAKCIYDKLKSSSTGFKNAIKQFDGEFPVAHLKYKNSSTLPSTVNAQTSPPSNFLITIQINENNLNRPNLSIARTIIHETIHAEMFRMILSILDNGGDLDGLTRAEWLNKLSSGDYPGIYDYYVRFGVNDMQHEQMSAHYRNIIQNMLAEFQPGLSQNIYEALAWVGLKGTETWNALSNTEKTTINSTINTFNASGAEGCN